MNASAKNARPRTGYTLVEMLVAVALVLLIMLLLASVFEMASATMTKQRGTAENDQQARSFTTILKGDLCVRSFRFVYPFAPGQATTGIIDPTQREGYFSISENDPNDDTDDVLSFTINYAASTNSCLYIDQSKIPGKTVLLKDPASAQSNNIYLQQNPNQPEFDNGYPIVDNIGLSAAAEVAYFLRGGNLYRRVLLVREIYDDAGDLAPYQPSEITGPYPLNGPPNVAPGAGLYVYGGTGKTGDTWTFWRDFDYSAVLNTQGDAIPTNDRPFFLNYRTALNNVLTPSIVNGYPVALGIPHMRFGHWPGDTGGPDGNQGRVREWLVGPDGAAGVAGKDDDNDGNVDVETINGVTVIDYGELGWYTEDANGNGALDPGEDRNGNGSLDLGSDDVFIGRFNLQECAHSQFGYPGQISVGGNPYTRPGLTLNPATNLVAQYGNQTYRRGEDILLTNVLSFDVKVWDNVLSNYVDLGHSQVSATGQIGHYHIANNRNFRHGNRYDTWHPSALLAPTVSPYRPATIGPDLSYGVAAYDDDGDGPIDDPDELGWPGSDDEVPLRGIRITVKYLDPARNLVRQVTIDESLRD